MDGITPADEDVFQPYDAVTSSVILALEDVGFSILPSTDAGGEWRYAFRITVGDLVQITWMDREDEDPPPIFEPA